MNKNRDMTNKDLERKVSPFNVEFEEYLLNMKPERNKINIVVKCHL